MKLQGMVWGLSLVLCGLGCGKAEDKEPSAACKKAADTAHQGWGVYLKAVDKGQPDIEKKAAKFAPEGDGFEDLAAASTAALAAWQEATLEAKELAIKARIGQPNGDKLAPGQAALAKAEYAREKAGVAIERAFAARLRKGADVIKRDEAAVTPDGKKLSAAKRKAAEAKVEATKARVAKNNGKVASAKQRLADKADALVELAKRAVEFDEAAVAACAE